MSGLIVVWTHFFPPYCYHCYISTEMRCPFLGSNLWKDNICKVVICFLYWHWWKNNCAWKGNGLILSSLSHLYFWDPEAVTREKINSLSTTKGTCKPLSNILDNTLAKFLTSRYSSWYVKSVIFITATSLQLYQASPNMAH